MGAVQVAALLSVTRVPCPHIRDQHEHAALIVHIHVAVAHIRDEDADVRLPPQFLSGVDELPPVEQREVGGASVSARRAQELERICGGGGCEGVGGGGDGSESGGEQGGEGDVCVTEREKGDRRRRRVCGCSC